MNIYIVCSLLLILVQGCQVTKPNINPVDLHPTIDRQANMVEISKEAAIAIANKDVIQDYKSLDAFRVVSCEQSIFWRIIYDGGGPEYVIDKSSGRILKKQMVPQGSARTKSTNGSDAKPKQITQQEAIAIARKDIYETYGDKIDLDQFVFVVCELSNVWRIICDYRLRPGETLGDLPNANFPKYVIDKGTGKILHKEMN